MGKISSPFGRRSLLLGSLALVACGPSGEAQSPTQGRRDGASTDRGYTDQHAGKGYASGSSDAAATEVESRMRQLPIKFYMAHW